MKIWITLGVGALVAAIATGSTQAASCKGEAWLKRPDGNTIARYYPPRTDMPEGSARIGCKLLADGRLARCHIIEETPLDAGYGKAVLDLARYFQLDMRASCAHVGDQIEIPVRFTASPASDVSP